MPKDRIVNNFFRLLIIFAAVYVVDSLNLMLGEYGYISPQVVMDYKNILIGASSQLYIQYFIYTLLFSKRAALRWTLLQALPILVIVAATWIGDAMGLLSQFKVLDYGVGVESLVVKPIFVLRVLIVLIQLVYALVVAMFSFRLIPLYQDYIERTESNAACNMIWVKEVCILLLALSMVYTVDAIFSCMATAILYFIVAIISFARVTILMLKNYAGNFNINGDLYATIGLRWSLRRLWHLPSEDQPLPKSEDEDVELFLQIEWWILSTRAYTNCNFSFKDVVVEFPQVEYNIFSDVLLRLRGVKFQSYVRDMRIELAMKIMEDKDLDVQLKEVALDVGFECSSSFSRAFKSVKGITASRWRAENVEQ